MEPGIIGRINALEIYLDDIYGDQEILRGGIISCCLMTLCEHCHHQAIGLLSCPTACASTSQASTLDPPRPWQRLGARREFCAQCLRYYMFVRSIIHHGELAHQSDGELAHQSASLPEFFATYCVRAVNDYASCLLRLLRNLVATNGADLTVVVLTLGVANAAYFEHSLLVCQMGVELVEDYDLFCRDNQAYMQVHMRAIGEESRVDVLYRRIDDAFLDPLQFRVDSVLGLDGLVNAAHEQRRYLECDRQRRQRQQTRVYLRADHDRVFF